MATDGSAFNPAAYYRFFNPTIYPNYTISSGLTAAAPPGTEVTMTPMQTFSSSENWQIFFSSGTYFIRNYNNNASLQLGLTEDNTVVPQLLNSSGALGQQWDFKQRSDGSWRITNALTGNNTALGLAVSNTVPGMDTDDSDGLWAVSINVSAGTVTDESMLASVQNVQTPTSSATSVASASSSSGAAASNTASSIASPAASNTASIKHSSSSSISGGAIAGIVIAIIGAIAIAGIIFFFVSRRRRRASNSNASGYIASNLQPPQPPSELDGEFSRGIRENKKLAPVIEPRVELP